MPLNLLALTLGLAFPRRAREGEGGGEEKKKKGGRKKEDPNCSERAPLSNTGLISAISARRSRPFCRSGGGGKKEKKKKRRGGKGPTFLSASEKGFGMTQEKFFFFCERI